MFDTVRQRSMPAMRFVAAGSIVTTGAAATSGCFDARRALLRQVTAPSTSTATTITPTTTSTTRFMAVLGFGEAQLLRLLSSSAIRFFTSSGSAAFDPAP